MFNPDFFPREILYIFIYKVIVIISDFYDVNRVNPILYACVEILVFLGDKTEI